LNVHSIESPREDTADDRSTRARIRDAAIEAIGTYGISGATARRVADAAGVSPGLVIHHFGSMDGLRRACDDHIADAIRRYKESAITEGPSLDLLAAFRRAELHGATAYLANVLVEDSPTVGLLVDHLVDDAESYLELGVETGMMKPTVDPRRRAVVIALWSLGALVLHRHVERLLGVDLTDDDLAEDASMAAYVMPAFDILGRGVLTDEFLETLESTFSTNDEGAP
jgi:AcrR family transcriptional regulator